MKTLISMSCSKYRSVCSLLIGSIRVVHNPPGIGMGMHVGRQRIARRASATLPLALLESRTTDNLPKVNSDDRIGSVDLCGQVTVGDYLDSETGGMT